ncbi:MAG: hypothetical protein JNJ49_06470 [Bdellovibrionaceae bacterium]|nr:hypothetical protein [Pseudobdellovibrionaceae bacterium]
MNTLSRAVFSILLTFITASSASAWTYKGNGGYAVVCTKPENAKTIVSAELLDLYEGRTIRAFQLDLGPGPSFNEHLELILKRLEAFSPRRAQRYREQAASFLHEARFLTGVDLGDIGDADPIVVPVGCTPKPVVNQREPEFPGDPRYIVQSEIWNALDESSKAALILHELVYRELKQDTSLRTRYFVSMISSTEWVNLTTLTYFDLSRRVGFPSEEQSGVELDLSRLFLRTANGIFQNAYPVRDSVVDLYGQSVFTLGTEPVRFFDSGEIESLTISHVPRLGLIGFQWQSPYGSWLVMGELRFWPGGVLASGRVILDKIAPRTKGPGWEAELGRSWNQSLGDFVFKTYPSGALKTVGPVEGTCTIENTSVAFSALNNGLELFENGRIKSVVLKDEFKVIRSGKTIRLLKGHVIELDESGRVLCGATEDPRSHSSRRECWP